ncbi:MdtA/MuxA family multidrug efflux RND transporter periplasmic adaptor subunit [Geotalea sp. SG265]|uniref:MdtA/MuxA family multidrug efflux RND transporter periplasmic adaptor subunit n=1 Tax=Geotalea sp. SG265 TaxID=2922867 RepID=UPI001FAFB54B|nr:MdtA/MuxA family multidrug efflux RND transporter periplasmic adaptor subunit [Geotalea sp. SG265]
MAIQERKDLRKEPRPEKKRRHRWGWLMLIVVLVGVVIFFRYEQAKQAAREKGKRPAPPTPVVAMPALVRDMGIYLDGLGTVTPVSTVTVRSRVDGQLMAVHYREGQMVEKGALLATIDPRPFQAQLLQAEGQMARDREQLRNARLDLARYRILWQENSIPRQQLDTQEALVRQLEGVLKFDRGQVENARLQLHYSRITAPAGGRVGLRLVDAGNIIHSSDTTGLAVITQLQPITVVFPIAEDSIAPVLAQLKKGARLPVETFDREQKHKLAEGTLLTIDNQVDPTTGTVRFRAVFPNEEGMLFPNQFVNARVLADVRRGVIAIPTAAIQRGPQGIFVFVVRGDKTVELRHVQTGITSEGETAIEAGLKAGELVVVDGAERLKEGSRVEVRSGGHGKK